MATLNQNPFWQFVHAMEASLPAGQDTIYVTSVENLLRGLKGGAVFEAPRKLAAQRIVENTHQLSTPAEIQEYQAAKRQREETCAVTEASRKTSPAVLMVDRNELKALGQVQK